MWRWLLFVIVIVGWCGCRPPPSLFVGAVVAYLRRCLSARLLPASVAVCRRGYYLPPSLFVGAAVACLCRCLSARLSPALPLFVGAAVAHLCRCLSARLSPALRPLVGTAMAPDRRTSALIALFVSCLACCRKARLAGQPPSLHFGAQVSQSLHTQVSRSPHVQVSQLPNTQVSHSLHAHS